MAVNTCAPYEVSCVEKIILAFLTLGDLDAGRSLLKASMIDPHSLAS